jgi:hypothetical protein
MARLAKETHVKRAWHFDWTSCFTHSDSEYAAFTSEHTPDRRWTAQDTVIVSIYRVIEQNVHRLREVVELTELTLNIPTTLRPESAMVVHPSSAESDRARDSTLLATCSAVYVLLDRPHVNGFLAASCLPSFQFAKMKSPTVVESGICGTSGTYEGGRNTMADQSRRLVLFEEEVNGEM